jgi:hypothetical protein
MLNKSTIGDIIKYNNSSSNINVSQRNVQDNNQYSLTQEELGARLIGTAYSYVKGESSDIEVKEILARYPTIINTQQEGFSKSILHIAIEYNKIELVDFLLKCKAINLYLVDKNGWGIIHYAAHYGNVDVFALAIKNDPQLLEHKAHDEKTPLMIAKEYGQDKIVSFIESLKEKEVQNINNNTSREEKNFSIQKVLQERKPDPYWPRIIDEIEDARGETAYVTSITIGGRKVIAKTAEDKIFEDEFRKCQVEEGHEGNGVFEEVTKNNAFIIEGHVDQSSKWDFEGDFQIQNLSTSSQGETNIRVENVSQNTIFSPNTSPSIAKRQLKPYYSRG